MVVRDLFYNTPARLKFMKKDAAEASTVAGVVQHLSLSNPHISFQLIKDGGEVLHTPGDNKLSSAIYAALGRDFALGLQEVDGSGEGIAVRGYVTAPLNGRGTRGMQIFFVNGRYVKSQLLSAAVEEAYKNQMMKRKFPGCVLNIDLPREWVDVNVHPAKTVVKFVNDRQVFSAVYHVVQDTLDRPNTPVAGAKPAGQVVNPRGDFYQQMDAREFREKYDGKGGQKAPGKAAAPFVTKIPPAATELGGRVSVHDVVRPRETAPQPKWHGAVSPTKRSREDSVPAYSVQRPAPAAFDRPQVAGSAPPAGGTAVLGQESTPVENSWMPVSVVAPAPETAVPAPRAHTPAAPGAAAAAASETASAGEAAPVPAAEPEQQRMEEEHIAPWRLVGEVLRTYIIAEDGDTVWLIDKHAAHERINFDRLKANTETIMGQQLLCPEAVKLEPEDCAVLLDQLELLEQFGFEAEDFGGDTILVRSIPSDIDAGQIRETLEMLAEKLRISGTADPEAVRDAMLHTMACKAAIKGGWVSDRAELQVLVDKVQSGEVRYCPHGRPVAVKLTKYELEKMFKRA